MNLDIDTRSDNKLKEAKKDINSHCFMRTFRQHESIPNPANTVQQSNINIVSSDKHT